MTDETKKIEGTAEVAPLDSNKAPVPVNETDDKEAAAATVENDEPGTPTTIRPLAELATPGPDGGEGPTGDAPVDGFVPGDQTAAGYFTPDGAKHPGEPARRPDLPTGPGVAADPLDPHGVNR